MSLTPRVSIVIPCFNAERWIAEAIESALRQTYERREVIVIDDGSTDGSMAVIRSFGDAVRSETGPNRGGCAARNRGIAASEGEFVQFLDADDLLHADMLEKKVAWARRHPEAIVYCDHELQPENGGSPVVRSMECRELDGVVFVLRHRALTTMGPLHRKSWLVQASGFREGLRACQEFDLHLRLAATGRPFSHLPEALFTVRRHPGSVSGNTGRALSALNEFLPDLIDDIRSDGKMTDERRREFAAYSASAGRLCCRHEHFTAGMALLNMGFRLDRRAADRAVYSWPSWILRTAFGPAIVERLSATRRFLRTVCRRPFTGSAARKGSPACAE